MVHFKDDLAAAQERTEAWWGGDGTDRPVLLLTAPRDRAADYDGPSTDDMDAWWTDPEYVIPRLGHQLATTYFAAESMPVVFPVSIGLVSITNKYLGAPNVYIDRSTSWSSPIIKSWDALPDLRFNEHNEWWLRTERLLRAGVAMIRERDYEAFIGMPDLNGPTEVLSGLRGPERFALDFYDHPDAIVPALRQVQDAWFEAYRRACAIANEPGGSLCWMATWSERPMSDLQSDVSCLISSEMFNETFLPFIVEQAQRIDRTIYHLDGPGAIRHLDSLLAIPELDAIQWVQGAGAGRTSEWIDLLRRIQDEGKLVWATCDPDEVGHLCRALDPRRLLLSIRAPNESAANEVIRTAERESRG